MIVTQMREGFILVSIISIILGILNGFKIFDNRLVKKIFLIFLLDIIAVILFVILNYLIFRFTGDTFLGAIFSLFRDNFVRDDFFNVASGILVYNLFFLMLLLSICYDRWKKKENKNYKYDVNYLILRNGKDRGDMLLPYNLLFSMLFFTLFLLNLVTLYFDRVFYFKEFYERNIAIYSSFEILNLICFLLVVFFVYKTFCSWFPYAVILSTIHDSENQREVIAILDKFVNSNRKLGSQTSILLTAEMVNRYVREYIELGIFKSTFDISFANFLKEGYEITLDEELLTFYKLSMYGE